MATISKVVPFLSVNEQVDILSGAVSQSAIDYDVIGVGIADLGGFNEARLTALVIESDYQANTQLALGYLGADGLFRWIDREEDAPGHPVASGALLPVRNADLDIANSGAPGVNLTGLGGVIILRSGWVNMSTSAKQDIILGLLAGGSDGVGTALSGIGVFAEFR